MPRSARPALIGAGVAILLLQPTNYNAEGYRILWTLCGVGIGMVVTLLAGLLAKKRRAKAPPQPVTQASR